MQRGRAEEAEERPLVIPADASLVDGLRALLVHHLKRSVGASIISLSTSQAELLEHHLARLASYAQKIVHTLAFATRFLSKHHFEGDSGELESPHIEGGTVANACASGASARLHEAAVQGRAEQHPQRKALKLNDSEILSLYRSAQIEASIEADWRGIQGPTPIRGGGSEGGGTNRSASSFVAPGSDSRPPPERTSVAPKKENDQEYLRMLSRALQQPGRSPRAFTAEILDPSLSKDTICCQPRVGTMLSGVLSKSTSIRRPDDSSAGIATPKSERHRRLT